VVQACIGLLSSNLFFPSVLAFDGSASAREVRQRSNVDRLHNGDRSSYSFVSLSNLAFRGKVQNNTQTKVRPVGLIKINTKA